MSRIVLTTWGTYGDLHPFIAIALGLKSRGHQVTVASAPRYRSKVEGEGLQFHPVRPDFPEPSELPPDRARRAFDIKTGVRVFLQEWLLPAVEQSHADLLPVCKSADLVVAHGLTFTVPLIAEQFGTPWLSAFLAPFGFHSVYDPPLYAGAPWLFPLRKLGRWPYSLIFALKERQTRRWARPLDELRRKIGLAVALKHPLIKGMTSDYGSLALFSSVIGREQPDWPNPTWITGFPWHDSTHARPGLSADLEKFLSHGEPPVVFTLGDSARMPGNFTRTSLEVVRRLDLRAVLLIRGEHRGIRHEMAPGQVLISEYEPYSQIFPHATAIVHPGGIGTIALALRACRPMLLVPHAFDQPDNSERARSLGVARVLDRRDYNPQNVCRELSLLFSDPKYRATAKKIGSLIQAEDGVATACRVIENVIAARIGSCS